MGLNRSALGLALVALAGCTPVVAPPFVASSAPTPWSGPPIATPGPSLETLLGGVLRPAPLAVDGPVLLSMNTPDGAPLGQGTRALTATPDAQGGFRFASLPLSTPTMIACDLPGQRRLTALALPGERDVVVDLASTAVLETLRGQVGWDQLTRQKLDALRPTGFVPPADALTLGRGQALRAAHGSWLDTAPGRAGLLDAWAGVLGYRPRAITRLAGGGDAQSEDSGEVPARDDILDAPSDAVRLPGGDLLIVDGSLVYLVPSADRDDGLWAWDDAMAADRLYAVAGGNGVYVDEPTYSARNGAVERAAVRNPVAAPTMAEADLWELDQVAVERLEDGAYHLYFTSSTSGRVFLLPGAPLTRHGRTFEPGRLYTLLGIGGQAAHERTLTRDGVKMVMPGDGNFAHEAGTYAPTALALAPNGDLYLLDAVPWRVDLPQRHPQATAIADSPVPGRWRNAFYGSVRVIRADDGTVEGVPLKLNGRDLVLEDPRGLALVDGWLYVVEHDAGTLLRAPLAGGACEVVATGLDHPGAIAPAPTGGLLVADRDRLQRFKPGQPPELLAGARGTPFLEGDARQATLPETVAIQPDPETGELVLTDYTALVVRRLR